MIIHSNIIPTKGTVLIVDDDPAVRGSLEFSLKIEGYNVKTYACGADVLDDLAPVEQNVNGQTADEGPEAHDVQVAHSALGFALQQHQHALPGNRILRVGENAQMSE